MLEVGWVKSKNVSLSEQYSSGCWASSNPDSMPLSSASSSAAAAAAAGNRRGCGGEFGEEIG